MNLGAPELVIILAVFAVVAVLVLVLHYAGIGASEKHHTVLVSDATPEAFIQRAASVVAGLPQHTLSAVGSSTLIATHRYRAGWRAVVAVFFFPIGLLALLGHDEETAAIAAMSDGGHTRVTLNGAFTHPLIERINSVLN
jgi:hypothetical protein